MLIVMVVSRCKGCDGCCLEFGRKLVICFGIKFEGMSYFFCKLEYFVVLSILVYCCYLDKFEIM